MIALFAVIPLFIVSYLAQSYMLNAGIRYINNNVIQQVQHGAARIDDYFSNLDASFNSIITDTAFQRLTLHDSLNEATRSIYISDVRKKINASLIGNPDISAILLVLQSGQAFHMSRLPNSAFDFDFNFSTDPVYGQLFDTDQSLLIGPHPLPYYTNSLEVETVSYVKPVRNTRTYAVTAWIVVELQMETVKSVVKQVPIEAHSSILLYNTSNGNVIQGNETPLQSVSWLGEYLNAHERSDGSSRIAVDGHEYQMAYQGLQLHPWTLVTATPLHDLMQGINLTRWTTFGVAAFSFLLAFLLSYAFINRLLMPLYVLKSGMSAFSRGNAVQIETKATNELGFLIHTFNSMLDDRQQLERNLLESSLREKDKELLQLQAQVNPHFLFNTLGTIQALALQGDKTEFEHAIYCLSQLLRYNSRIDEGWAMLEEEINYVQYFQRIHYYRHGRGADIQYDVAADCKSVMVMKLSILPFVENALKYGWNENTESGIGAFQITVHIRREGHQMHVHIRDSGPGFDPASLSAFKQLFQSGADKLDSYFSMHTGIYNVYRRLRLVYGDLATMNIHNLPEGGALIAMQFPTAP